MHISPSSRVAGDLCNGIPLYALSSTRANVHIQPISPRTGLAHQRQQKFRTKGATDVHQANGSDVMQYADAAHSQAKQEIAVPRVAVFSAAKYVSWASNSVLATKRHCTA